MANEILEIGKCEECEAEINLTESWRVNEKFFCQNCFDQLDL